MVFSLFEKGRLSFKVYVRPMYVHELDIGGALLYEKDSCILDSIYCAAIFVKESMEFSLYFCLTAELRFFLWFLNQ